MFLTLNHQKPDVYSHSRLFVLECYKLIRMISQIRRAALSVHLNVAEGASRQSAIERKRFYEISRGSIIEIDAAIDIASELQYLNLYDTSRLGEAMLQTFKRLSGLIKSSVLKE
jgi:four helix bundle protein